MPDKVATRFAGPEDSPGYLMWVATNRWQAAVRAALLPLDLTHVQFVLLATLRYLMSCTKDAPRQVELARQAATDPMMTSQVLRALEAKKLLRRVDNPDDRRAKSVRLTPAGAELADRAVEAVEACDSAFFGTVGTELVDILRILCFGSSEEPKLKRPPTQRGASDAYA